MDLDAIRHHPTFVPLAYIVGGITVAIALLSLDTAVGSFDSLDWLWVGPQTARSSLVGLVTSFLFVISVVFWVRIWAVQVTAGSVLPRVLSTFLTDRVQQHAMGFLIGAIAYVLTVLRAVPEDDVPEAVPHVAVAVAYVVTLAVAVIIVLVIHNAARASQVSRIVREIAEETIATIRDRHPVVGEGDGARQPTPTVDHPRRSLQARGGGWIQVIDEGRLLGTVASGSVVELAVRRGTFVLEGQRLATLSDVPADWDEDEAVRAFHLAEQPRRVDDVAYGINELVDIATRSVDTSTSDSTAARDALLHLGMVVRELLMHDLPPTVHVDDEGRTLVRGRQLGFADYCEASFGRMRDVAAGSRELLSMLVATMHEIAEQLVDRGLHDRRDLLQEQVRLALEVARRDLPLRHDLESVARRVRAFGIDPGIEHDDDAGGSE